ncbi:fasciclin domain-containing protein [Alkalimarinus sediminis]|uniref:Fasciclin domain-containing protein n=1 Tax=Alkalimarinus sediminis TaxID=1632866 RepID=A0A9E8KPV7_9ALTE|nr:fasciclin domain-containing protein [Alkalimarinus sediminis]UZW75124.1 fasciclin domain-containing protein [Alkalimarinus sediminis]
MSTQPLFKLYGKKAAAALVASSALLLSACSDDNNSGAVSCNGTIAEIANCDDNFDTLFAAVDAAGLGETLSGGEFTVFAPTDAAFDELFTSLGVTPDQFLARPDLADILTYHVLSGSVNAEAAISLAGMANNTATTVETSTVTLTLSGSDLFVNRSQVVTPDVIAENGIIHAIDKVLVPPNTFNVVETAQADGRFNTLVAAVVEAGLVDTLATTPNLTVFAPTDDAFENLIASNDSFSSAADILALTNLGDILKYHVLSSEVDAATAQGLAGTKTTPLLTTEELAISYADPNLFINTSKVIVADVDTSNGLIHAVDKVLLPPTPSALSDTGVTIAGLVTNLAGATDAEFTTLLAALQQEGLDGPLAGAGPFTVFAPTDAAFDAVGTPAQVLALPGLDDILKQHVISGSAIDSISAYAANGSAVATLRTGTSLNVNIGMGNLMVGNANVVITDVETSNGVVHVIDAVITAP